MPQQTAELGSAIRSARDRTGRSTQVAAEQARISPAYLNKLESGRVGTPSPHVLHRLAAVIDVPYWTLMHLAGYVPADDADPGRAPEPRAESRPGGHALGAATNERLLEELQAIRQSLEALQAGARSAASAEQEGVEPAGR